MKEKSEIEIKADICRLLNKIPQVEYTVTDASSRHNIFRKRRIGAIKKGWADITGIIGPSGRFFCIECKTLEGELDEVQKHILRRLESRGALIIVAHSAKEVEDKLYRAIYDQSNVRKVREDTC